MAESNNAICAVDIDIIKNTAKIHKIKHLVTFTGCGSLVCAEHGCECDVVGMEMT